MWTYYDHSGGETSPNQLICFTYSQGTRTNYDRPHAIRIEPSTKLILASAFAENVSLVKVEFSEQGLVVMQEFAFRDCCKLKEISNLPSSLEVIGDFAFIGCQRLHGSIQCPAALRVIGRGAFRYCSRLTSIQIPSTNITSIQKFAFELCESLQTVELPEGLRVIEAKCFKCCRSLTTINIPLSVVEIKLSAFEECTSLTFMDLESVGPSPTGRILEAAVFQGCTGLSSVNLPKTLTIIPCQLFLGCTSLTNIQIPPNVTRIEEEAFSCCSSLTHVRLPPKVKKVERGAFTYCEKLLSLELPEGLEELELHDDYESREEFLPLHLRGCKSLVNCILPSSQIMENMYEHEYPEFMDDLKLSDSVEKYDYEALVDKLKHRFDDRPVHRLCYYQSYFALTETTQKLQQAMLADPSAGTTVDAFGMSPFHILALSETPNLQLFQVLVTAYSVEHVFSLDMFQAAPMHYLCCNQSAASTAVIEFTLQTMIARRLKWIGSVQWQSEVVDALNEALSAEWETKIDAVRSLFLKLEIYERFESISLLESALWSARIDEAQRAAGDCREEDEWRNRRLSPSDRQACRIICGVDVVIPHVLPFLD